MHLISKRILAILLALSLFGGLFYIQTPYTQAASTTVTVASDYNSKLSSYYRTNCVYFARYMVPSLPTGLTAWSSKKAIVNSTKAVVGSVAIVKTSNVYGHVSYVEKVNGSTITTIDANWTVNGSRKIVRRTGTASALGIVGYYVPKNLSNNNNDTSNNNDTTNNDSSDNNSSVKSSITRTTSKNYSTSKGVAVYAKVTKSTSAKVTSAGLYLWKTGTSKPSSPTTSETFSAGFTNQSSVTIYYRPGIAVGSKLKSKTTYNYQIYAVVDGKKLTTSTGSIKTK